MENMSGQNLKGYELRERIGAGGFGAVYRAYQPTVGREVAIKIILPGFANESEFIRRFEMEAQIVARLEHPFIVPLYDYWRDPGGAYLVMRYLRGGSLHDALKGGLYDTAATARLLDQVTGALEMAHRHEVIHRDIKPGNILLDEDGNAYLADFGIAKDLGSLQDGVTQADAVVGSLDYISPEQARGEPVTSRTDLYSLGVVLYEMLEGQHPFPASNPVERLYHHINDPLPEMCRVDAGVRAAVNAVIQKATAKNPAHRYADALEMASAFREAAAIERVGLGENLVEQLTRREQEVLRLLVQGCSNKDIANQLFVEISTVKWYNNQIFSKLGVRSRMQAIVRARELNLVVDTDTWESGAVSAASSIISLPEPENPYKGLRAFQPVDHRDFFGREQLTQRLLERLSEKDKRARFLAVVGPSGSGKSSLVKAGLIPALWRGELPGSDKWFIVDVLPGHRPVDELEIALMRVAANQSANIHDQLTRDENGLQRVAKLILPEDGSELVVVIDQFEEVFTLVEDEGTRQRFLDLIRAAVSEPRSRVRVVVTLRADFYDRPLHYPEFGELVRSRMETVLPLTAKGLERAIAGPAERVGVTFEEGLVAQVVSEMTYQSGALPLLQYALTELFEQREGRVLTHQAYREIGGAVGALAKRAEDTYAEMPEEAQECVRQMFLRLVTLGEGSEDTRRRTPRSELLAISNGQSALMDDIIDTYAEYRLLTLDNDPTTRSPTVEVAHEAMLREWERLREWLNESRDEIRLQRQLARMTGEWRESGEDRSFLVGGARLTQFEVWAQETALALTPQERAYLDASMAERERQAEIDREREARESALKQRAQQVLQVLAGVFLVAAVISGGLALWANSERGRAETERKRAEVAEYEARRQASIGLASQVRLEMENGNQDVAVLLGLEALEHYPYTGQAESALADAVEGYIPILAVPPSYHGLGWSYVWSSDGARLASNEKWITAAGSEMDMITVMDASGSLLFELSLEGLGCTAYGINWAPVGERLASIYTRGQYSASDCTALPTVWDTKTGERVFQLSGHEGYVLSVAWSPDGAAILTAGEDGTARVWSAETGEGILAITGHAAAVSDAAWSPDGAMIITASLDGTARIWDIATGAEISIIRHPEEVTGVDWSPDGLRVVTASADGLARIWDAETGELVHTLHGDTTALLQVVYSPDGTQIATKSATNLTKIWEARAGILLLSLPRALGSGGALSGELAQISWSPNGESISVNSKIWDISQLPLILAGHTGDISSGMWTPDGTRIVTTSVDGTARIWDAVTGEEMLILEHPNQIYFPSLSPDGTRLVTPCVDGKARIWDIYTGELLLEVTLSTPEEFMFEEVWSPDGARIFSTGSASPKVVWDASTGEILVTLDLEAAQALLESDQTLALVYGPSWSPDSTRIATGPMDAPLIIWDAMTGQPLEVFEGEAALRVDWSPDGLYIADCNNKEGVPYGVWEASTGELLQTYTGHYLGGTSITWSPGGTRIASGGNDGLLKVWNPFTGEEVRSLYVPGTIYDVQWSSDERNIIVVGAFGIPLIQRVWPSTQALIDEAYECCVTRELTPEERTQFGLPPRE